MKAVVKVSAIAVLSFLMNGCGDSVLVVAASTPSAPDQSIAELRRYAHTHKYWWHIFCVDGTFHFQAEICKADCGLLYIEEGAKGRWSAQGLTQNDAARNVLYGIGHKPTGLNDWLQFPMWIPPDHAPQYEHKQCPRELSGGPEMSGLATAQTKENK